ncbi:23S rRNA (uracil-5-)-methyltransferase [gamma proteobacterium HTCC5015]|nr:23S rRNA (uracil-5-)-methyltransferase [gamma proteobacterium HTCC5015]
MRRHPKKHQRSPSRQSPPPVELELDIERLSFEGRGIAQSQGKTCFVEGALPNERVRAKLTEQRRRFNAGYTLDVIKASPQRVTPPCPHYQQCGGCDLQHLSPQAQTEHKRQSLLDTLARQANIRPHRCLDSAVLNRDGLGYRSRARLACWFDSRRQQYHLGFRRAGSHTIEPISQCPILVEPINRLIPHLRDALPQWRLKKRLGHIDAFLNESPSGPQVALCLRLNQAPLDDSKAVMLNFAQQHNITLAWRDDHRVETLHGDSDLTYYLLDGELKLSLGWGEFSQANRGLNREMVRTAVEQLHVPPGAHVLDAFCGVGNFSLALANGGAKVLGLEGSDNMVEKARHNARDNGFELCEFKTMNLMHSDGIGRHTLDGIHHALLDPPRDGASELCQRLAREPELQRVLYISCNPATFSRDAEHLVNGGFTLDTVQLWDLFPHTHHSEVMGLFVR